MVAAFELVDRPVERPKSVVEGKRDKVDQSKEKVIKKKRPWKASFQCPYCNIPINVSMEFDRVHTYAVALQAVEGKVMRVGQRKPDGESKRVGPRKHNRSGKGYSQNAKRSRRFGFKGDKTLVSLGQIQDHKKNEPGEKKRYTWREKEK